MLPSPRLRWSLLPAASPCSRSRCGCALVHALFDGEKNVNALVEVTGGTQTNVSRHLQTLTQANVLARRKEGLQVFYSIADPSIFKLCELVCGSLEKQFTKQAGAFSGAPVADGWGFYGVRWADRAQDASIHCPWLHFAAISKTKRTDLKCLTLRTLERLKLGAGAGFEPATFRL